MQSFARSTPEEIPDCAIPLLFETGIEETPYGHAGTGFIAVHEDRLFIVTAAHCIKAEQHNALRVPISQSSRDVARLLDYYSNFIQTDSNGPDEKDIAFFTVAHEEPAYTTLHAKAIHLPITFGFEAVRDRLQPQQVQIPLIAIGYPERGAETNIDYDKRVFTTQAARLVGDFQATWPNAPDLHTMKFREPSPVTNLGGFSGGPVFGITKAPGTSKLIYFLVGMMLMGGFPIGHFVSVTSIRNGLMEGLRKEAKS